MRTSILLLAALHSWTAPDRAADKWIEARSAHFVVATNAGERDAREILYRFELFRAAFSSVFPRFRVDPGPPIVIIAARNEATMKEWLPDEWATEGHMHPAGIYMGGLDRHYVILRLDVASADAPYVVLYHEYTHVLLHLNFSRLPVWLDEGLAEYFGFASASEKEVRIGLIAPGHLQVLRTDRPLPIAQLLTIGRESPYYNEADRASVFYAESWALVHYLMLNPEARQQQLLSRFLASWEASGDQVEAARAAFGDLDRFGTTLTKYTNQARFYQGVVKPSASPVDKEYTIRPLTAGEVLALRADFFVRHNRAEQAAPLLAEAVQLDPGLPVVHEALGIYHYRRGNLIAADSEMLAAIRLGSKSFAPHYYHGLLLLRGGAGQPQGAARMEEASASLERAIQVNPDFAPAHDALASAYERTPGKQPQAVGAAFQATKLAPSTVQYAVHFAAVLMNAGRDADAHMVADRAEKLATTPAEKSMVAALRAQFKTR